ncbi:hypothetical protein HYY69_05805 [Candidatus Woesearchaeota archaeon]|nr:hypothetical protein [Candidatus Woesearchaeota archaeon]
MFNKMFRDIYKIMVTANFRKKKGYFFTMDSIIALFILVIGMSVIFAFKVSEPPTQQSEIYSLDLMNFLAKTKIKEINDQYVFDLINKDIIRNTENTVLEQLAEFNYRYQKDPASCPGAEDCLMTAKKLSEKLTAKLVPQQYGFKISIYEPLPPGVVGKGTTTLIYENKQGIKLENARVILPVRRLVHGLYEDAAGASIYGPYLGEVVLWQ